MGMTALAGWGRESEFSRRLSEWRDMNADRLEKMSPLQRSFAEERAAGVISKQIWAEQDQGA